MLRKFIYTLGAAALLTTMASCRPSEDNKEYEPKVARIEVIADKITNGTATPGELMEVKEIVTELQEVEDKEGKVLSSGQYERLEKVADQLTKK